MKSVWLIFYLLGNFVEIILVSKNAPRGAHCGGAENVAIATCNQKYYYERNYR